MDKIMGQAFDSTHLFTPSCCGKRCIYCDQGAITERNGGDIHAIIRGALEKQKGPFEVGLYGGNIFGIEPSILRELFLYFKAYSDLITNFRVSTRPSPLIRETIEILKESKVTIIELGIPSFNDMILKHLKRRIQ
jgi:histone acetyltransferase (RNA polymerase elongator complex component)